MPRPLAYKAVCVASKLEREGAGAKVLRPSEAEGALSRHACALAAAPGLTVAGCSSEAQSLPSSARHGPLPFFSPRPASPTPLFTEHPEMPIVRAPLDADTPTCQEVGPRGPAAWLAGSQAQCG